MNPLSQALTLFPSYVRADADIAYAAENIVDGAMYNSGQSCCAVERVYVHESVYDAFVEKCVEVVKVIIISLRVDDEMFQGVSLNFLNYVCILFKGV